MRTGNVGAELTSCWLSPPGGGTSESRSVSQPMRGLFEFYPHQTGINGVIYARAVSANCEIGGFLYVGAIVTQTKRRV